MVFGRTPVAEALVRWARELGFRPATELPEEVPTGAYAVHTDHDDPDLADQLERVLRRQPRFVGVMGSRRHTSHHLAELRRRGVAVDSIRSPVGLEIGAGAPVIDGYRVTLREDLQWVVDRPLLERVRFDAEAYTDFRLGRSDATDESTTMAPCP